MNNKNNKNASRFDDNKTKTPNAGNNKWSNSNSMSNKSNLSSNTKSNIKSPSIKSPNIKSPNIKIKSPDPSLNLKSPKPRLHSKDLDSNSATPSTPGSAREYKSKLLRKVNSNQKSQYSSQTNFNNNSNLDNSLIKNKPEYRQYANKNHIDSNNASHTFFTDNKN